MEIPSTNIVELLTEIRDELRTLNERLGEAPERKPKRPRKAKKGAASPSLPDAEPYVPTELDRAKAIRLARELGFKQAG